MNQNGPNTPTSLGAGLGMHYVPFDPNSGWPAGAGFYYECQLCGFRISSMADAGCSCGNLWVQESSARIGAKEEKKVRLLKLS